jgi:homoserine kinase
MKMIPELFDVQRLALKNGALMSTLSGSGSTFFTLCYADDADHIAEELRKKYPKFRVFNKALDNYGVSAQS